VFALRIARRLRAAEVELVLDSKLVVEQLSGRWRVKDLKLQALHREARELLGGFERWRIRHEPRANNHAADALANLALDDPVAARELESRLRVALGLPPVAAGNETSI
jgi:ribonuclease H / adenosylcobalamin/alpha-ribazole phosphatase